MELSEKNKRFAEAIVYGDSASIVQAYRDTRETSASVRNARAEASRLWRSPLVQAYAERLRADLLARGRARAAADRERIVAALWSEADGADRAADRIAALRTLGQVSTIDLFGPDRVAIEGTADAASAAELADGIEALLRDALGGAEVGEVVDAEVVPPTPINELPASFNPKHQNAQTIPESKAFSPQGALNASGLNLDLGDILEEKDP